MKVDNNVGKTIIFMKKKNNYRMPVALSDVIGERLHSIIEEFRT